MVGKTPSLTRQSSLESGARAEQVTCIEKEIDFQEIQEAQRVPKKFDTKGNTPRHIIIKLPKIEHKERTLKAARGKERVTYKGMPIRLSASFSKETLQARRGWKEVFEVMKGKDLHLILLYPARLSFRMEGQTKCFSDKVKLKEFILTKSLFYEMLKDLSKKMKMMKSMNSKMIINSQLSTTEPKKRKERKQKQKLSKQLEQEHNHRNGHHMEGFHGGEEEGKNGQERYREQEAQLVDTK